MKTISNLCRNLRSQISETISNLKFQILCFCICLLFSACASSTDGALDSAIFSLDACSVDNLAACTTATEEAQKILDADSTNTEAALIKSSAFATRGGFDMLKLVAELSRTGTSGTTNNDTQKFQTMHTAVVNTIQDVADLRSSIEALGAPTLSAVPATTASNYGDYYFQLGILQAFEAFTLATITAQPTATSAVNVALITSKDFVQDDFIAADNSLIASGITSSAVTGWDLVTAVRQNYCALSGASVGDGFTLEELKDLVKCQLCLGVTDTSICSADSSVAGAMTFVGGELLSVANCAVFVFTNCGTTNTAL